MFSAKLDERNIGAGVCLACSDDKFAAHITSNYEKRMKKHLMRSNMNAPSPFVSEPGMISDPDLFKSIMSCAIGSGAEHDGLLQPGF